MQWGLQVGGHMHGRPARPHMRKLEHAKDGVMDITPQMQRQCSDSSPLRTTNHRRLTQHRIRLDANVSWPQQLGEAHGQASSPVAIAVLRKCCTCQPYPISHLRIPAELGK